MIRQHSMSVALLVTFCGIVGAGLLVAHPGGSHAEIEWATKLPEAHRDSRTSGRPVLIVFEASWCKYGRQFEREVLTDTAVVELVNRTFVPVRLNYDRSRHTAAVLEIESLPATVVLSPEGDLLGRTTGYVDAEDFVKTLVRARRLQDRVAVMRRLAAD